MEFRTDEPFSAAQALQAGLTRRRLQGKDFEQVPHGIYTLAPVRDRALVRARAALLVHPATAVASRSTAARLLRAPITLDPGEHVTVPHENDRRRRLGVRCHIEQLSGDEIVTMRGVSITSPARLFVDLAGTVGLVELVVLGDWLVLERLVKPSELIAYCARVNLPHITSARRAASYAVWSALNDRRFKGLRRPGSAWRRHFAA